MFDRRSVLGGLAASPLVPAMAQTASGDGRQAYRSLLGEWMDGLLAHQIAGTASPRTNGGFICPACAIVHGRSGDAVYPLLAQAKATGASRYVAAALAVHGWSEANTSRSDGSWVNDPVLSGWKGITVFRAIALAESLDKHSGLLDARTVSAWRARLQAAMGFLDGFITIDTGNINYPISAAYAYALSARVLGDTRHEARARSLAHQALGYFSERGLLFGEGRPQRSVTPRGCRPVDLGYNVEESLPALALYARLTSDREVEDAVVASLSAHLEFMLPDGAWDNSWGSRNYKWTYWGSRTSDGCHGALVLLADRDPRFLEAANRNLALMRRTTAGGLLAGGPDYRRAGYAACLHHGMSHAKSLATVVDAPAARSAPAAVTPLPRDLPYGLRSWPEIDTHLVAVGDWRATVTGYDFDYLPPAADGHAGGGSLVLLHHLRCGPLVAAGMLSYRVVEVGNQQVPLDGRHRSNVPGIYGSENVVQADSSDSAAGISADGNQDEVRIEVLHGPPPAAGAVSRAPVGRVTYLFRPEGVTIEVAVRNPAEAAGSTFVLPVICRRSDAHAMDANAVRIRRGRMEFVVRSDAGVAIEDAGTCFNLVPGFEFIRVKIPLSRASTKLSLRIADD